MISSCYTVFCTFVHSQTITTLPSAPSAALQKSQETSVDSLLILSSFSSLAVLFPHPPQLGLFKSPDGGEPAIPPPQPGFLPWTEAPGWTKRTTAADLLQSIYRTGKTNTHTQTHSPADAFFCSLKLLSSNAFPHRPNRSFSKIRDFIYLHEEFCASLKTRSPTASINSMKVFMFFFMFHSHQSEVEEVRQVLWLSVVLYKFPEAELTCCLLLSTDTVYFLLEDSAATLGCHSGRLERT